MRRCLALLWPVLYAQPSQAISHQNLIHNSVHSPPPTPPSILHFDCDGICRRWWTRRWFIIGMNIRPPSPLRNPLCFSFGGSLLCAGKNFTFSHQYKICLYVRHIVCLQTIRFHSMFIYVAYHYLYCTNENNSSTVF